MIRRPNCVCKICNKKIYRRPIQINSGAVYCSLRCCGINQRVARTCTVCKKEFIGAKRTCSRACANKGRRGIRYLGENIDNKAYQGTLLKEKIARSRGGVCEKCGLTNYSILQIHHKVERARGGNDALSNLELLCPNCHMTHHIGFSLFPN